MIASYGPLHWETGGEIIVWGITLAILCVGSACFRSKLMQSPDRPKGEGYFTAFAYTLLLSNAATAGLFLIGLVFLAILQIVSVFWIFWQLFYLISIPMVFHVFPVLTVIAWGWSLIGWWRMRYASRTVFLAILLTLAVTFSAVSYFAFELVVRQRVESMQSGDAP